MEQDPQQTLFDQPAPSYGSTTAHSPHTAVDVPAAAASAPTNTQRSVPIKEVTDAINTLKCARRWGKAKVIVPITSLVAVLTVGWGYFLHFRGRVSSNQNTFNHDLQPIFNKTCGAIYDLYLGLSDCYHGRSNYNFSNPFLLPACADTADRFCDDYQTKIMVLFFSVLVSAVGGGMVLYAMPHQCLGHWFKTALSKENNSSITALATELKLEVSLNNCSLSEIIRTFEHKKFEMQSARGESEETPSSLCCC